MVTILIFYVRTFLKKTIWWKILKTLVYLYQGDRRSSIIEIIRLITISYRSVSEGLGNRRVDYFFFHYVIIELVGKFAWRAGGRSGGARARHGRGARLTCRHCRAVTPRTDHLWTAVRTVGKFCTPPDPREL